MRKLTVKHEVTLLYCDGPVLRLVKDDGGRCSLAMALEEDREDGLTVVLVPTSPKVLEWVTTGKVDVRWAFEDSAREFSWWVSKAPWFADNLNIEPPPEDVKLEDLLPEPGLYL